jgi:sugar phosphate isomerase/epimerase
MQTTPSPSPSRKLPLSGLADEAADHIEGQIAAHRALGWTRIELRLIGGKQAGSEVLPEADFERAVELLNDAGIEVSGFASAIGNWSRPIAGDFQVDLNDLTTLCRRMQRTGARIVRTMSWVRGEASLEDWRDEAVRRYKIMAPIAEDAGILLLHENCEGWGGLSPENAVEFLERVNHPAVAALFDIGNTVAYGLEPWSFYRAMRPFIRYVHVKDANRNPAGGKSDVFTYPGQGDASVGEILADLVATGYDAGVTIEPHVASIVHLGGSQSTPEERFDSYVRYGRALEALLA